MPNDPPEPRSNQRRVGRWGVDGLSCNKGEIIDLSVRGMRIRTKRAWVVGQRREIVLSSRRTRLVIPARCVWARRDGLFSWTIGLAFDAANVEQLTVAGELALIHAARLESVRRAA